VTKASDNPGDCYSSKNSDKVWKLDHELGCPCGYPVQLLVSSLFLQITIIVIDWIPGVSEGLIPQ
jgi:hypothetical protein